MIYGSFPRLCRFALAPLLALATLTAVGYAQERNIRFRRLSIDQGLSQSAVNCILQDRHGFVWIGTEDGLNRYDGYTFTVYKHDSNDPGSLSDSWVWALHEDSEGVLWVGTRGGGLNRFIPETESFERLRNLPADPTSLSNDTVRVIFEDSEGTLWVGTAGGLNRFDRTRKTFDHFAHNPSNDDSLVHDAVLAIHEDRHGKLWIGTQDGGLDELDPTRLERGFVHHRHDAKNPTSLSNDRVFAIEEDRDGQLWVATGGGGLNRLDPVSGKFEHFRHDPANPASLAHDRVLGLFRDRDGALWVGTDNGLNEYLPESETFVRYGHDPVDPRSLSNNRVTVLFQDRGGVLWVGTKTSGLNLWNAVTGFFSHFKHTSEPTSLSNNIVTAFAEVGDDVWVGTLAGLNRFHRPSRTFEHFRHDPSDPSSLSDDRVGSLLVDASGSLWVGTFTAGLNRLDRDSGRFERFLHDPEDPTSLGPGGEPAIFEDSHGVLWVATHGGGLNRFNPSTRTFVRYTHESDRPTSLGSDRVMTFEEDSSGVLWIGTAGGGLNRMDRANGSFSRYQHDPKDPTSLSNDEVITVHEARDGALWVGTQAGLNRWEREDRDSHRGVFQKYTEHDGLPNNFVYGILEDDDGHLWLSTNRGLSRFDPRTETFKNFEATHGLQSNEFNVGAYFESESGEMFFGGVNGYNAFYPSDVLGNGHAPPVVVTNFLKFNRPVRVGRALTDVERIELDYRDYLVTFEFAALDFTAPEKNTYAYKLEGFDSEWIDLGHNRRATFTNLAAGDYTFRVRGANNDNVQGDGVSLQLRVLPPPWKTWWAYSGYGVLFCGLLFVYARAQRQKLEREAEYSRKLELEVQQRTREIGESKTELEKLNAMLEEVSLTDALTGLKNRRYLTSHVQKEMEELVENYELRRKHERRPAHDVLLLMIDLDGFKSINDTYGHSAGDEVLVKIREVLRTACRESDTLIRWGGDEFLVTGRTSDPRTVEQLAERIRAGVEACRFEFEDGEDARVSCSIGFACFPFVSAAPRFLTWEQVLAIADRALYAAKHTGRNAWVGILSAKKIPTDENEFIAAIERDPQTLMAEEMIDVVTSISRPLEWGPVIEPRGIEGDRGAVARLPLHRVSERT